MMQHIRRFIRKITGNSTGNYWADGYPRCRHKPGPSGQRRCQNTGHNPGGYCNAHYYQGDEQ